MEGAEGVKDRENEKERYIVYRGQEQRKDILVSCSFVPIKYGLPSFFNLCYVTKLYDTLYMVCGIIPQYNPGLQQSCITIIPLFVIPLSD